MEREALLDAILVGGIHQGRASQGPTALGIFALQQMALTGARAEHLAARGYLEPLGSGFFCLNAFWTSHNWSLSKKSAQYRLRSDTKQGLFL